MVCRIAGIALLVCGVVASDSAVAAAGSLKAARFAILYVSDWEGPAQIFAVDPAGKTPVGQVTSVPLAGCDLSEACVDDPLPSPDGRHLLYYTGHYSRALWLSLADGSAARLIAASGVWAAAWSPDSSRFAYLADCCVVGSVPSRLALHVVSAGGLSDRIVGSYSGDAYGVEIVWSADGGHVKTAPIAYSVSRSPDGRWKAIGSGVYHADGSLPPIFNFGSTTLSFAWSPDSRYLAYVNSDKGADEGIHVLDTLSRTTRLLTRDVGCFLAWSPDGRMLAYLRGASYATSVEGAICASVDDLRTVTPDGHVRVVAAAGRPFGPSPSFAWTRVPAGVRYRAPSPVTGVYTGSTVTALGADGGRVGYATCAGVFTWDMASPRATEVASVINSGNCVPPSRNREGITSVALAGDRLAYVDAYGGNTTFWSVRAVSLGATPSASAVLASGSNTSDVPLPEVGGSGGLLTLATRDIRVTTSPSDLVWHIQTVGASGCPCQEILSFQQSRPDRYAHLDDVDAGRVVINGGGFVRILDGNGTTLLALPVQASEAALSGDDLVVHVTGELQDYSVSTETLLHTWPAPVAQQAFPPVLQDVARGLAAYVLNGELHLLRLRDGTDTVVGPGSLARFTDAGLAEAAGPRVQVIPYSKLPLH